MRIDENDKSGRSHIIGHTKLFSGQPLKKCCPEVEPQH